MRSTGCLRILSGIKQRKSNIIQKEEVARATSSFCMMLLFQDNDTLLQSFGYGFGAIIYAEFLKDDCCVEFYGAFREMHFVRNSLV